MTTWSLSSSFVSNVMDLSARRCSMCRRPTAFYPYIAWQDWCGICDWHWFYGDGLLYFFWSRSMQAKSPLGGCPCILRNVSLFVTDSSLLEDLRSGLALSRLREVQMCAVRRRWQRILLYGGCDNPRIRDENTGEVRFLIQTTWTTAASCLATWTMSTFSGSCTSLTADRNL